MGLFNQDGSGSEPKGNGALSVTEYHSDQDHKDNDQLARLGKKKVLKRSFHFISIMGFSCTVLVTWEGTMILFAEGLVNGGPMGTIISFIIVWLGNLSVFAALCELVSMAPTSGGQYHWVSMLAPKSSSKFLSYVTGWLTIGGWQGAIASAYFLTGSMLQGMITLAHPSYSATAWQGTLLMWAVGAICVFFNCLVSSLLPKFETLVLVIHVAGFFGILISVVHLAPHYDAEFVFQTFVNGGQFPTKGLSFFVGMTGNVFAFAGADAAFHMCEEVENPSVVVPQSIMTAIIINGTAGLAMTIAMLFCLGDIDKTTGTPTGFPFMEIFRNATGSRASATGMTVVIVVMALSATIGIHASVSRVYWAFSRDRGFPGWRALSKVSPKTSVPRNAVILAGIIASLLGLINIGSAAAFTNIVSLSISGLHASYFMAASLLLYRRCTNGIVPAGTTTTDSQLVWGPWRIGGAFGIINNGFALVYLIIIWFFSFWPVEWHVTAKNMNYGIVVTTGVALFSMCYYFIWAKRSYHGPVVET